MNYPLYPADPTRDPADPFRALDPAPSTQATAVIDRAPDGWSDLVDSRPPTPEELVDRQRDAFGGPKVGSAFFGWLIASATATLLIGLFAAVDIALGLGLIPDPWASGGVGPVDGRTVGWIAVGVAFAIMLVAFHCGGYVAGRMARFNGVAQGVVVWLWAVAASVVGAVGGLLVDSRFGLVERFADRVPLVPLPADLLVTAGVVAVVAAVVVSLGGAMLGGVVGVRYHRRVDRAGLEDGPGRGPV